MTLPQKVKSLNENVNDSMVIKSDVVYECEQYTGVSLVFGFGQHQNQFMPR